MNANKFQLNNIVKNKNSNYEGFISAIRNETLVEVTYPSGVIATEFVSDIEPIRLTPEWLLSREFESDGVAFWNEKLDELGLLLGHYAPNNFHLFVRLNKVISVQIKHVHHFQNLYLGLTGEELN